VELSNITNFASTRFAGFEKDKDLLPWDMSSNSELKIKKFYKNEAEKLTAHNVVFLSRTYPKGTRFDSSNYMPTESWAMGCQLTALNYQTADVPMFLNTGKFMDNGKCGYLLKSPPLLPTNNKVSTEIDAIDITVKILSGWQLPKVSMTMKGEVIDPYLNIKLIGIDGDNAHYKTKVVNNNGFHPIWDEEVKFRVQRRDLAILLIQVYDEDKLSKNDFVAFASFPVTAIRNGYRSVQLYNSKFEEVVGSSLLIHITCAIVSNKRSGKEKGKETP